METKFCKDSLCIQTFLIQPNDTNNFGTLFGGNLMSHMDTVAAISAFRHCRGNAVTASTDSVDFLCPIEKTDILTLESFVSWTGKSSMEIFVKAIAEDIQTGNKRIAATAFLTFVCLGKDRKPLKVPKAIPESEEEKKLNETAPARAEIRKQKKEESKRFVEFLKF